MWLYSNSGALVNLETAVLIHYHNNEKPTKCASNLEAETLFFSCKRDLLRI